MYTLVRPCCTSRLLWRRGRLSDCHPGDPGRSSSGSGPKIFFFTCHIWRPTLNHPMAPCSNSRSLIRNHSLWPGTSRTKPNLVGENVTGYRYMYTLVWPCCTSRLLWRRGRVSDCHPGDPGSILVQVRSEDIFLHLSHFTNYKRVDLCRSGSSPYSVDSIYIKERL